MNAKAWQKEHLHIHKKYLLKIHRCFNKTTTIYVYLKHLLHVVIKEEEKKNQNKKKEEETLSHKLKAIWRYTIHTIKIKAKIGIRRI